MKKYTKIESILFVSGKPVSLSEICKLAELSPEEARDMMNFLFQKYNNEDNGINIIEADGFYQMAVNPENFEAVEKFTTEEIGGELTKAQLETLTVIAYLGPITKPELEELRGVNCALIIRNLLMRGLIKEAEGGNITESYFLTVEALAHLGVRSVKELPDYEKIRADESLLNLKQNV